MIDFARVESAWQVARRDLLESRDASGSWIGELASSALSTATAVSALTLTKQHAVLPEDTVLRCEELVARGTSWLLRQQNSDGGWGDTDRSLSNIATTLLVQAAFRLAATGPTRAKTAQSTARAENYVAAQGGLAGLRRRYGRDKTFAVPILTNCALAGMVPWREVSPLPFEAACLPQSWYRLAQLPVVSYAIPALVAIGQAKFIRDPPSGPLRWIRRCAIEPSLEVLQRMQPASGGYLEAIPLTSFVVMSLASTDRAEHPVTREGLRFLLQTVRPDGSWPIDSNLATWNTTLAINALAGGDSADLQPLNPLLEELLDSQYQEVHPFTGAAPGGWGWTPLSGAVPDADDTPGALLALHNFWRTLPAEDPRVGRIERAAEAGIRWLLNLQNRDGGWPTFCRGWGKLPFDRSGADLTAHVLRALMVWMNVASLGETAKLARRVLKASTRGFAFLARVQRPDGSWIPLWFGNQYEAEEENPVYGTAKVLLAYRDAGQLGASPARAGMRWLTQHQNADGGWGGEPGEGGCRHSSVEETSLALEALAAAQSPEESAAWGRGITWLTDAVRRGEHHRPSPIGFYFAKLWYYERQYPLTFAVAALGLAVRRLCPLPPPPPHPHA